MCFFEKKGKFLPIPTEVAPLDQEALHPPVQGSQASPAVWTAIWSYLGSTLVYIFCGTAKVSTG